MISAKDNLSEFTEARLYELENKWSADDEFYLAFAKRQGGPLLELACGTGRLAEAVARSGLEVFGLDLAEPMLRVARQRAQGLPITLLLADMTSFALAQPAQAALMTGHAWQMLLTPEDQRRCLASLHQALRPGALFAFETRNAAATDFGPPGQMELWRSFQDPRGVWVDTFTASLFDPVTKIESVEMERRWRDGSRLWPSRIQLKYSDPDVLDALLAEAGFAVEERYGDFHGQAFTPQSAEIVTVARRLPAR